MTTITGGCLCGAVRYTAEADVTGAGVCHCPDCRKFTGSVFATVVMARQESVTFSGSPKAFSSVGGSGNQVQRHFCPECGSSLAAEPGMRPGMLMLNVGTLDDPAVVQPALEIFRDNALPWVQISGDIPRFAKTRG
jgi:hypothetical protein